MGRLQHLRTVMKVVGQGLSLMLLSFNWKNEAVSHIQKPLARGMGYPPGCIEFTVRTITKGK